MNIIYIMVLKLSLIPVPITFIEMLVLNLFSVINNEIFT